MKLIKKNLICVFLYLQSCIPGIVDAVRLHGAVHRDHKEQPDPPTACCTTPGLRQMRTDLEPLHLLHAGHKVQP